MEDPKLWPTTAKTLNEFLIVLESVLASEFRREHKRRYLPISEDEGIAREIPTAPTIFEELLMIGRRHYADWVGWAKAKAFRIVQDHRPAFQKLIRVAGKQTWERLDPATIARLLAEFVCRLEFRINEEASEAYLEAAKHSKAVKPKFAVQPTVNERKIEGKPEKWVRRVKKANPKKEQDMLTKINRGEDIKKSEARMYWRRDRATIDNWLKKDTVTLPAKGLIPNRVARRWLTEHPQAPVTDASDSHPLKPVLNPVLR